MSKRILLLSPYDALSHSGWRNGLAENLPEYQFEQIALPPRYFSWRFRGNSLTLAHDERLGRPADLLLATSMTDLAGLKGMRPALSSIPSILYFHENQFAYPAADERYVVDRQLTSLYSAVSADTLVFNSGFNRKTFLEGAGNLLARMPDHVPSGIVEALRAKSRVLPVPVDDDACRPVEKSPRFSIVWNHRWEFDKGVEELREIVRAVRRTDVDCRFHLLGQRFRRIPAGMQACLDLLGDGHLGQSEFVADRSEYLKLLGQSHLVLSTARHEFQGIAVLEAVAAGCTPVVPDGLVYPELFESKFRYKGVDEAVRMILEHHQQFCKGDRLPVPDVTAFAWSRLADDWRSLIHSII